MPLEERKSRYEAMVKTVREDNIAQWTANFTADLAQVERD